MREYIGCYDYMRNSPEHQARLTSQGEVGELPHGVDVVESQIVHLLAVPQEQLAQRRHGGQVADPHVRDQITPAHEVRRSTG